MSSYTRLYKILLDFKVSLYTRLYGRRGTAVLSPPTFIDGTVGSNQSCAGKVHLSSQVAVWAESAGVVVGWGGSG